MADLYRKSSLERLSNPEQLDRTIKISSPLSWLALIGVAAIIVATIIWSVFGKLPEMQTVNGIITAPDNTGILYAETSATVRSINKKGGDKISEGDTILTLKASDGSEKTVKAKESGILTELLVEEEAKVLSGTEVARYTPSGVSEQLVTCYAPLTIAKKFKKDMKVLLYPTYVDSQTYGHMEATITNIDEYPTNVSNLSFILGSDNMVANQLLSNGPVVAVTCKIKSDKSSKSGFYWTNENGKKLTISNGSIVSAKIIVDESAPINKLFNNIKSKLEG